MKKLLLMLTFFTHSLMAVESSKIFESIDAEYQARIIITPAEKSGFYYINYRGFEHHFDGSTLLYQKLKNDLDDGHHYKLAGLPDVNVRNKQYRTLINGSFVSFSQVFLDNDTVTRIIYVGKADIVQARRVKEKYLNRQLTVVSKVAAKKTVKQAQSKFEASCNTQVVLNIDWSEFKRQGLKTAPAKVAAYLAALEKVCLIDADYLEAVQEINKIEISVSSDIEQHNVRLNDEILSIAIGDQLANLTERSYKAIYDMF